MSLSPKQTRWCCEGIFFLFAFLFLGVYNADYLFKLQAQDLFLTNNVFVGETLPQTAGVLVYVSKFINQLLYFPLLGGALMAVGLVGVERLVASLAKSETNLQMILAFVPSLLVLLAQTSAGYAVYENFDTSFAVSLELGVILSLSMALSFVWLMDKLQIKGCALVAVATIALYFVIGNLSAFAMMVAGLVYRKSDAKIGVRIFLSGIVLAFVVAYLATFLYQEDFVFTLIGPIEQPYFNRIFHLSVAVLLVIVALVWNPLTFAPKVLEKVFAAPVCLVALSLVAFYCSYRDANYRTELRMQRCVDHMDFDGALKASEVVSHPTQPIAAYRYIALIAENKLNTELFNFPVRYDTLCTSYTNLTPLIYYPDLFFYSSELNLSLFWTMETWTNTRRSVSALKRYALIAIMQNEKETAFKYLSLLKQTLSYRAWAKEFEQYVDHPKKLFAAYPVLKSVYEHQLPFTDHFAGTSSLSDVFFSYVNLDPVNMERRLLLHLYEKDTDGFMQDLQTCGSMYQNQMPECMQEIVALYDLNTNIKAAKYFPISQEEMDKVRNFVAMAQPYANDLENGAEQLKGYKGMYLYYLLFSNPHPKANINNVKK